MITNQGGLWPGSNADKYSFDDKAEVEAAAIGNFMIRHDPTLYSLNLLKLYLDTFTSTHTNYPIST